MASVMYAVLGTAPRAHARGYGRGDEPLSAAVPSRTHQARRTARSGRRARNRVPEARRARGRILLCSDAACVLPAPTSGPVVDSAAAAAAAALGM